MVLYLLLLSGCNACHQANPKDILEHECSSKEREVP